MWTGLVSSLYPQPEGSSRPERAANRILGFPRSREAGCVDSFQPSGRFGSMQTISLPYRCSTEDRAFLDDCRRVYSAVVRTAYANGHDVADERVKQKPLRDLVKSSFAGGILDAWALHCATPEGMDLRKRIPDGRMVFGGRATLERRRKDLIRREDWRRARLRPMTIRGDKNYARNRHFRLSADGRTCVFTMLQGGRVKGKSMVRRSVTLDLQELTGNAGEVLRQAAQLAAARINVTFRIDDARLHVTVDPEDLPEHPQRRRPALRMATRAVGLDLNPAWVGIASVENSGAPARLDQTRPLDRGWSSWDVVHLCCSGRR